MRGPSDVERTAKELRIDATLHGSLEDASTVQTAADALDIEPAQIGKSIVLMVNDAEPVIVIVAGQDKVDFEKVADHVSADPENVRMADADEVSEFTGYDVGGVPPLGHARPLRTLVDTSFLDQGTVYVGGGSDDVMVELDASDLRKLPDVTAGSFAR